MQKSSTEYSRYQKVSAIFKEMVDTVTTTDLSHIKLFCKNVTKKIQSKKEVYDEFKDINHMFNTITQAKGKTVLHYACAKGDVKVVSYLIETLKLDYHIKDKEGNNPFFTAVEHGNLQLVQYFVEELKLSALSLKEGDISCLHVAANSNNTQMIGYFLDKGCDLERMSIYGKPINWSVGSKNIDATIYLLNKGADPNGDLTGPTPAPIFLAIDYECKEIYDALIASNKININVKDPQGNTPLHVAAEKGNLEIVKDLIDRGADIEVEAQGKKPLYVAFENNKMEVVSYLRERTKDSEKVEKQYEEEKSKVVVVDKEKAEQMKAIGNKLYGQKNYQQALIKYQQALTYDPQNEVVHRNIAACYLPMKKYQQALDHCQKAKAKDAKNVKTIYREAQAYIGLNNLVDAAASLWQCSRIQPQTVYFQQQFKKYVDLAKKQHGKV